MSIEPIIGAAAAPIAGWVVSLLGRKNGPLCEPVGQYQRIEAFATIAFYLVLAVIGAVLGALVHGHFPAPVN